MSRRDTIIIAVLINAGLLVVLFSTALKSSPNGEVASVSIEEHSLSVARRAEPPSRPGVQIANAASDEVDQLLRQFSQSSSDLTLAPVAEQPSEQKNAFTQDLNALASDQSSQVVRQPVAEQALSSQSQVVVKKGDVLEKIARTHHTTVEEIMKTNGLTSTRLKIGQVLNITEKVAKSQPPQAQSESTWKYYTVKNGDNPWTIAVKNHMKVDELLKMNNLDAEKARHLKPGDQLRIR